MKLLLVENNIKQNETLTRLLKNNGYIVNTAVNGETGVEMALTGAYDVIILDQTLPGLDGLSLLKEIRDIGLDTLVLFLTAKDSLEDRIEGLDAGADDYLVKPFFDKELLAKLKALTRRKRKELVGSFIKVNGLTLEPLLGEVSKGVEKIKLTTKESALLELLMLNAGNVVTKGRIMEKIWGYNSDVDFSCIEVYIHRLRKKLNISNIMTVRKIGYCLRKDKNV